MIEIDCDMHRNLFLRCEGKKIVSSTKTNDFGHWMIASLKLSADETEQKLCLITTNTDTIIPYHISIVPLKVVNQARNTNIQPDALIKIEENPFLTIEQPKLVLIPTLQKLESRVPDAYMEVLWNPGGQMVIL